MTTVCIAVTIAQVNMDTETDAALIIVADNARMR